MTTELRARMDPAVAVLVCFALTVIIVAVCALAAAATLWGGWV